MASEKKREFQISIEINESAWILTIFYLVQAKNMTESLVDQIHQIQFRRYSFIFFKLSKETNDRTRKAIYYASHYLGYFAYQCPHFWQLTESWGGIRPGNLSPWIIWILGVVEKLEERLQTIWNRRVLLRFLSRSLSNPYLCREHADDFRTQ